jgi:hypothetical protein
MESVLAPRKDPTAYLARALSWTALAICVVAFAAIVAEGAPKAPAVDSGRPQLARLEASAGRLADALAGLAPGESARPARSALHAAVADTDAVASALKRAEAAGLPADRRLMQAVEAHQRYLDAVASVLTHPGSTLRRQIADRERRVQAAFASLR